MAVMPFPTLTDLAFYHAKNEPRWASRVAKSYKPPGDFPNIDHVVNAHAGLHTTDTNARNLMVFVRTWIAKGEDVASRLREFANTDALCATPNRKRAALAKKWAARLSRSP